MRWHAAASELVRPVREGSTEASVSSPQRSDTFRGVADKVHQLGIVRDGERDIVAAATARRAAVCLDGEVSIGKQPDVERSQPEPLTAPGVGPPL